MRRQALLQKRLNLSDKYRLLEKIGEGAYGMVYKAESLAPSPRDHNSRERTPDDEEQTFAVKVIKTQKEGKNEVVLSIATVREIKILREMHHDNVVHLHDVYIFKRATMREFPRTANIRRNIKAPQQPEIDSQLAAWVVNANDKGASITGQVIKRKGQLLARESSTWMAQSASPADGCIGFNNTFKMYRMHGEAASANSSVQLNDDMCAANRKILLVWDNTSSHNAVGVELTHGSLPFTSSLARVTRTRSMETVVAVPLPPPNQAKMDELRMQSVEHVAASSSQFNQMIYEQLVQFYAQQEAMSKNVGRLLADFYDKLEQLDVAHLQSVKILTAAIRPSQLKATVERQLTREANKAYKSDVKLFCRWLVSLMDNFML
ncbi:hypothetical protein DYB26_011653, partial [Aphanomyces astaci]